MASQSEASFLFEMEIEQSNSKKMKKIPREIWNKKFIFCDNIVDKKIMPY